MSWFPGMDTKVRLAFAHIGIDCEFVCAGIAMSGVSA